MRMHLCTCACVSCRLLTDKTRLMKAKIKKITIRGLIKLNWLKIEIIPIDVKDFVSKIFKLAIVYVGRIISVVICKLLNSCDFTDNFQVHDGKVEIRQILLTYQLLKKKKKQWYLLYRYLIQKVQSAWKKIDRGRAGLNDHFGIRGPSTEFLFRVFRDRNSWRDEMSKIRRESTNVCNVSYKWRTGASRGAFFTRNDAKRINYAPKREHVRAC